MGYRSDVAIVVAFKTKEEMEEVVAVYRMDPRVQKHKIMEQWKLCPDFDPPYMVYAETNVKWYDGSEDVQAIEHIASICDEFANARGFEYAYRLVRLGEADDDTEVDDWEDNPGFDLSGFVQNSLYPVRSIHNTL